MQYILYNPAKSEILCNTNCLQISKFYIKRYTLHAWNSWRQLVGAYYTLPCWDIILLKRQKRLNTTWWGEWGVNLRKSPASTREKKRRQRDGDASVLGHRSPWSSWRDHARAEIHTTLQPCAPHGSWLCLEPRTEQRAERIFSDCGQLDWPQLLFSIACSSWGEWVEEWGITVKLSLERGGSRGCVLFLFLTIQVYF